MSKSHNENIEIWQEHVKRAREFSGSQTAYCESVGIAPHNLWYWKKRLQKKSKELVETKKPFVSVEVIERHRNIMPDPEWVAQLVSCLYREVAK